MDTNSDRIERRLQSIEETLGFSEMATKELTEQGMELYKRLEAIDRRIAGIERRLESALDPAPDPDHLGKTPTRDVASGNENSGDA